MDADQAAIGVLRLAGAEMPLEMMRERVLLAQMDHLGAGIGLLEMVGDGDGIEFAHANRRRAGCSWDISR